MNQMKNIYKLYTETKLKMRLTWDYSILSKWRIDSSTKESFSFNNHSPIIRLSIVHISLYNQMLLVRLLPLIEVLRRNQAGFKRGRSTVDQICALRRIFDGVKHKNLSLVATFVDFKKAFDSVNWTRLFEILKLYGVPDKLIDEKLRIKRLRLRRTNYYLVSRIRQEYQGLTRPIERS